MPFCKITISPTSKLCKGTLSYGQKCEQRLSEELSMHREHNIIVKDTVIITLKGLEFVTRLSKPSRA
jgi:hypothetical protein